MDSSTKKISVGDWVHVNGDMHTRGSVVSIENVNGRNMYGVKLYGKTKIRHYIYTELRKAL